MNQLKNEGPYQANLTLPGVHESYESYGGEINKFMDLLEERGINQLRYAYANYPRLNRSPSEWNGQSLTGGSYNSYLCYLGAYTHPLSERYFESEENIYGLPDDHAVHFVCDKRASVGDYRPYITPSSSCNLTSETFANFDTDSHRRKKIFPSISAWDQLTFPHVLDEVFRNERSIYSAQGITHVWLMDIPKRKIVDLSPVHIEFKLEYNDSYVQDIYGQSELIEWNMNTINVPDREVNSND